MPEIIFILALVMRRLNIICALGLLFSFQLQSQTYYEKGYLVNEKGDTIRGEVKLNQKKEFEIYTKVAFRDEKGIQKNHKPEKVSAYGFKDRHFVKMSYGSEDMYYEVICRGEINFYKLIFEAMYANRVELETEYFVQHGAKKVQPMKASKFKKLMTEWMEDHPDFINAYEETDSKKFDEAKAKKVVEEYNAWKASTH